MTDIVSTPAPTVQFVAAARRAKTIPLQWPIEYDGKRYDKIVIRRLSAKQVADLIESAKDTPEGEIRLPLFSDTDGNVLPSALLDELDDDDSATLNEVALDFFPRRFLPKKEPDSTPVTGGSTGPSSAK